MVTCSQSEFNIKSTSNGIPNLYIHDDCTSPSTSSTNENQIRGSSFGAVGCLRYVEDFEIMETLGQGFFGIVHKVREKRCSDFKSKNQSNIMVMKEPIFNNAQSNLCAKKIVSREYYMLRFLKHPNILKTRGVCVQQNGIEWNLRLLVDYCEGGSLQKVLLNLNKPFHWIDRLNYALDICKGMEFVHRNGFMHRDLTATNILLQKSTNSSWRQKAVIADFGLSCRIPKPSEIKPQVGTQWYMAPEVVSELYYDEKADIFSFGIVSCQMIARIDADHEAGLYRTSKFGLDYVRFAAHCPSDTPLNFLKTAFMSCLLAPSSRPSFEVLVQQIQKIINEDFPKDSDSFDGSRLGRSHSDATIQSGIKTPSITTLNGRRLFRPDQLVIPEGLAVDENSPFATTPSDSNELDERIKQLAATVADADPDYQESTSTLNPFDSHSRYRSIRKVKPGDRHFIQPNSFEKQTAGESLTLDSSKNIDLSINQRIRHRSVSMPSIFMESRLNLKINKSPLAKFSKRSFTLGLGEQRDLQRKIVATFREYDQKFTNISRSGILISSNDLSRLSNESLDNSILLSENEDEFFDASTSSQESLSPKDLNQLDQQFLNETFNSDNQICNDDLLFSKVDKKKNEKKHRIFRKNSDECRIL